MNKFLLRPLSYLYSQIGNMRNVFYDRGWSRIVRLESPVISIGNLTVGGTGKTPVTDVVIQKLLQQNKKVAVISRAYRAQAKAPVKVIASQSQAALMYGDEPVLLAQRNPEVSVYVGSRKWEVALFAQSQDKYDVFLVDDGYQHRRLHRDLNIVILDATEHPENYAVLPEGRSRESWQGLERSDLILLSKTNLAHQEDLKWIEDRIPSGIPSFHIGYAIHFIQNQKGDRILTSTLTEKNCFLVSAIARPDVFESMVRGFTRVCKGSRDYRDHHQYTAEDVRLLLEAFTNSKADYFLTTEKDAVKLGPLLPPGVELWTAPLVVDLMQAERGIDAALNKVFS